MKKPLAVLLVLCAVLCVLSLRAYYVGFFNDDAFYVIGARSLLQGRFVELNHPHQVAMINYFPGYPLLLAPLCAVFPSSFLALQLLSLLFVLVGLALAALLFEVELGPELALLSVALCAFNPLTLSLSGTVLSELPTFTLTPLFFILLRRFWPTLTMRQLIALSALAAFAFLIRPTGGIFIGALVLGLLLEKRWKPALISLLCFTVFAAPLLLRNWLLRGSVSTYTGEYLDNAASNLPGNTHYYLNVFFVETLFRLRALSWAIIAAGLIILLLGFRAWGARGWRKTLPLYTALYLLVYLGWSKQAGRYLFPLLPILVPMFLLGLSNLWARRAAVALSLLLCFFPVKRIVTVSLFEKTPVNTPPERTDAWIKANTQPDDVFATELDGRLYLGTGRKTYLLKDFSLPEVRYAILFPTQFIMRTPRGNTSHDPLDRNAARAALESGGFKKIFADEEEGSEVYLRGK